MRLPDSLLTILASSLTTTISGIKQVESGYWREVGLEGLLIINEGRVLEGSGCQ